MDEFWSQDGSRSSRARSPRSLDASRARYPGGGPRPQRTAPPTPKRSNDRTTKDDRDSGVRGPRAPRLRHTWRMELHRTAQGVCPHLACHTLDSLLPHMPVLSGDLGHRPQDHGGLPGPRELRTLGVCLKCHGCQTPSWHVQRTNRE